MARPQISTPAAILIAGAMISVSVFLGLSFGARGQAAPTATAMTPAPPAERPARRDVAPAPAAAGREQVAAQLGAALEAQRGAIRERCWRARDAGPPPTPVKLLFQFGIGADGLQRSRGVIEARGMGNPEVTRCILDTLAPVSVAPPGAEVTVEVPFGLP